MLRQNAIEGPWETSDYLLVCIGPDDRAEILVRTAGRMATKLNASWVVVHVERLAMKRRIRPSSRESTTRCGWRSGSARKSSA